MSAGRKGEDGNQNQPAQPEPGRWKGAMRELAWSE
jgi:hypothetical protein